MSAPSPPVTYHDWTSREEILTDTICPTLVRRLAATLDDTETKFVPGDPLPPLWHWMFFAPEVVRADLGPDGHPRLGGFLPPVGLPQRMFAECSLNILADLPVGAQAERRGEVIDIQEKKGRSGPLVFVKVRYGIYSGRVHCLEETHQYVYREPGRSPAGDDRGEKAGPSSPEILTVTLQPDPILLFRFSALIFNSHRIHYDRNYAVEEAGYPGLVVQGPLLALFLAEMVRRRMGLAISSFAFRVLRPVFDQEQATLVCHQPDRGTLQLRALRPDGSTALSASATVRSHDEVRE